MIEKNPLLQTMYRRILPGLIMGQREVVLPHSAFAYQTDVIRRETDLFGDLFFQFAHREGGCINYLVLVQRDLRPEDLFDLELHVVGIVVQETLFVVERGASSNRRYLFVAPAVRTDAGREQESTRATILMERGTRKATIVEDMIDT